VAILHLTKKSKINADDKSRKPLPDYDEDQTYQAVEKKISEGDAHKSVFVEVQKYIKQARGLAHNRTRNLKSTPKALSFELDKAGEEEEEEEEEEVIEVAEEGLENLRAQLEDAEENSEAVEDEDEEEEDEDEETSQCQRNQVKMNW
jgi:hypothetical protein